MLSRVFVFGDNISLDTWPKTITFVANGNCYVRLLKNSVPVSVVSLHQSELHAYNTSMGKSKFNVSDASAMLFPAYLKAQNMVRVIEGKSIYRWSKGKQKLLQVSGRFEFSAVNCISLCLKTQNWTTTYPFFRVLEAIRYFKMSCFPKQRVQNILWKLHRQKNSHDVKADILVFQINPVGVELFLRPRPHEDDCKRKR